MRVPHGSTVLVADGRKRLIARNEGTADRPALRVVGAAEAVTPRTHEIATDAAGRAPAGAGGNGGAPIESADPHDHQEVSERIIGEIDKDFTGQPIDAVGKMLSAQ